MGLGKKPKFLARSRRAKRSCRPHVAAACLAIALLALTVWDARAQGLQISRGETFPLTSGAAIIACYLPTDLGLRSIPGSGYLIGSPSQIQKATSGLPPSSLVILDVYAGPKTVSDPVPPDRSAKLETETFLKGLGKRLVRVIKRTDYGRTYEVEYIEQRGDKRYRVSARTTKTDKWFFVFALLTVRTDLQSQKLARDLRRSFESIDTEILFTALEGSWTGLSRTSEYLRPIVSAKATGKFRRVAKYDFSYSMQVSPNNGSRYVDALRFRGNGRLHGTRTSAGKVVGDISGKWTMSGTSLLATYRYTDRRLKIYYDFVQNLSTNDGNSLMETTQGQGFVRQVELTKLRPN